TPPPMYQRPPYPDYWLMSSSERALSTNVGTSRINWDLRYDDPPGYNPDINNQMNSAPGQVTPAPHGPLALPGTYTLKLLVDGATYTQTLVVHNDPRVGEGATVLSALRTQNKLAMAPTKAKVDTWESGCREFTATLNAWKMMLGVDLVGFNSLLTKNNLTLLKITPTALAVPASCTFVWPKATARGK